MTKSFMLVTRLIVVLGLTVLPATIAVGQEGPDWCIEAMDETLQPDVPEHERQIVLKACQAAFADESHRSDTEKACDRQADKVTEDLQFAVGYTCKTAMSFAYE